MKLLEALKKKLPERHEPTPRQTILDLVRARLIGRAAAKAISRRFEEARKAGEADPLGVALAEYEAGELGTEAEKRAMSNKTLADVPGEPTPKQALLWLHQQGAIGRDVMRAAAKALAEGKAESAAHALILAGAPEAAGNKAADPDTDLEAEPEADDAEGPDVEGEDDEEEDDAEEPDADEEEGVPTLTTNVKDLAALLHGEPVAVIRRAIRACSDAEVLVLAHKVEQRHPRYEGGRGSVLNAIEERKGELLVPNPRL